VEFRNGSPQAYKYAKAHDWLDTYDFLEKKKRKYTYEIVYDIAKKYTTYVEFRKKEKNVFILASHRGWLDDYTWLKKLKRGQRIIPEGWTQD
jgi:hypothetical protein